MSLLLDTGALYAYYDRSDRWHTKMLAVIRKEARGLIVPAPVIPEVDYLLGDATKARTTLGWEPTVTFDMLVKMMVESDTELARQERTLEKGGHNLPLRGVAAG